MNQFTFSDFLIALLGPYILCDIFTKIYSFWNFLTYFAIRCFVIEKFRDSKTFLLRLVKKYG